MNKKQLTSDAVFAVVLLFLIADGAIAGGVGRLTQAAFGWLTFGGLVFIECTLLCTIWYKASDD